MKLFAPAVTVALASFLMNASAFASERALPKQNVILITLDGVRAQDIIDANHVIGGDYIPNLRAWAAEEGFFFGSQQLGDEMLTGNPVGVSRPGYRALFTGNFEEECTRNYTDCPELARETFVNRLLDRGIAPGKIGLFASWSYLNAEMEYGEQKAVRSVAIDPIQSLPRNTSEADRAFYAEMQKEAILHQPFWDNSRKDKYTWAVAGRFLETRPRFLYVSLLDSDEWAHKYVIEAYSNVIKDYDHRIGKLRERLAQMKGYGENTSIIVTTDHGRGDGLQFGRHGPTVAGSREVWAFVIPSRTLRESYSVERRSTLSSRRGRPAIEGPGYSQLDIRPTVEALLRLPRSKGLRPSLVRLKKD